MLPVSDSGFKPEFFKNLKLVQVGLGVLRVLRVLQVSDSDSGLTYRTCADLFHGLGDPFLACVTGSLPTFYSLYVLGVGLIP